MVGTYWRLKRHAKKIKIRISFPLSKKSKEYLPSSIKNIAAFKTNEIRNKATGF
jgi:hypothetical protein